ncbi:hypothetical protein BN946_scf184817.g16 [Trametes cinnabarina]|uniref:Major facilitator superfamily (MFS) profile domain-containing protein n=1 Tax=Pycnoporus cinnabarinus TaxID=5643 RepID=A0A060S5J6_PYCCI|nr:hypothetical protein BN946_scf184817.g16 [Trametes cinnabarina]
MDRSQVSPPPPAIVPEGQTKAEHLNTQLADATTLQADQVDGGSKDASDSNVYIVDWDGPDDLENPKNWAVKKKWAVTLVVSSYAFLSPLSSSMMAPAANQIAHQFGVTDKTVIAMFTSIYVLAYGALSIKYTPPGIPADFLLKHSIGGGVLGDIWLPSQRGQAIAIFSLAPLLGPVIGPACGAWIAEKSDWRWVFWSTSIFCVFVQGVGLFYLQESVLFYFNAVLISVQLTDAFGNISAYAPVLLERRAARIRKTMRDSEKGRVQEVKTVFDGPNRRWRNLVQKALVRPFALSIYEPIIQVLAAFLSFVYGTLYLFLTTLPAIYQDVYRERVGIAGFHYFALGIGMTAAAQINGRFMDWSYKRLVARYGQQGKPEYRLPTMVPGAILLPMGLLLAGWTARPDVHWIVPDIGTAIVGMGMILLFQSIQTYVIDAFTLHAASALAALAFFRSLAGFSFPLFAPAMYSALGYGKGDTILACVAIAIGIPAPFLFWVYGERLRNASRYAKREPR